MSKSARTHRTYLPIALLLLASLQAPAQNILGKHPADKVLPQFFNQNDNANAVIDGLSTYGTHSLQVRNLDASQVTSGTFDPARIPGLPASQTASGTFDLARIPSLDATRIPMLDASKIGSGVFGTALIPSLDAGKIGSGTLSASVIPSLPASVIPTLDASKIGSGVFGAALIPSLDAGKIGTGTLDPARIPSLPASIIGSGTFSASVIPSLDASVLGSGTLNLARVPTLDLAHVPTMDAAHIPNLDASKITTGTLGTGLIPSLDASKINSGNLNAARIPLLDASKIASGTFGAAQIPSLDASKINSGTLAAARIPTLPASQVTAPGGAGSDGALLFNDGGTLDGDHSHLYVGHSGGTVNTFAFIGGANLDPDNPNMNTFVFQDSYDPGYPVWNLDVGSGGVFQVGSSINYGRYNPPTFRMGGDGIGLWDQAQAFVMDNYSLTFNTDNSFMVNANSSYFQFICDMQNGHVTLYDMDLSASGDITTQGMIRLGSSGAGVASGCGDPTQDGPYPCSAGTLYLGANATGWLYTGSEWRQVF